MLPGTGVEFFGDHVIVVGAIVLLARSGHIAVHFDAVWGRHNRQVFLRRRNVAIYHVTALGNQLTESQLSDVDWRRFRFESNKQIVWGVDGSNAGLEEEDRRNYDAAM